MIVASPNLPPAVRVEVRPPILCGHPPPRLSILAHNMGFSTTWLLALIKGNKNFTTHHFRTTILRNSTGWYFLQRPAAGWRRSQVFVKAAERLPVIPLRTFRFSCTLQNANEYADNALVAQCNKPRRVISSPQWDKCSSSELSKLNTYQANRAYF